MFPLDQNGELSFQISNDSYQQRQEEEDLMFLENMSHVEGINLANSIAHGHCRRGKKSVADDSKSNNDDYNKRKIIHRDIERKRRQEMANRYTFLRSILPLEYIKGRRSMCDHITAAINYIKHLQNNIKQLEIKREELKKSQGHGEEGRSSHCSSDGVAIHPCRGGLVIEITAGLQETRFFISRALKELHGGGLKAISCVSYKENQRFFHIIHCEASDTECIDLSRLRKRLTDIVCLSD
ncbi:hypothetical protein Nepgr_010903 [Nepenthes gracilis]|uniref:BHLH domain-containing protein n=1 Tax=Nepenthes gracilis TaxID=150966 RepID=A0AAD3SD80_NEPGR|nr:hypothetical protein Nepgr_010903 [Nepenthes gracilis]